MRPIWKGMVSFGMVNIPVTLYNATRKKSISFNQLRASDYSRIRYKKVAGDGEEVQQEQIVKGYELGPDRYAVITDDDLASIAPKASRVIEITDFVKQNQINPLHYDAAYYLVPDTGAGKAYALLLTALTEAGSVGIARFVLRNKEYLAAIRPESGALALSTMLFHDEIVKTTELETYLPSSIELTEKELMMARHLIDALSTDFEPAKYKNEYLTKVMDLIDQKAETNTVAAAQEKPGQVIDIMAAIEATMAQLKIKEKAMPPAPVKRSRKKTG